MQDERFVSVFNATDLQGFVNGRSLVMSRPADKHEQATRTHTMASAIQDLRAAV